ncbi:hypothetical protein KPL70_011288 [Citrus sinensis]|nr:hypothetical protein KPL70_011288 [Citrus sinensis]
MASATATALCPNHVRNSPSLLIPAVSSNPLTVSQNSKCSFSLPAKTGSRRAHNLKLKHPPTPCASAEGLPGELTEDSKFVPLNADDPTFGPPIRQFLKELDGEFLEVIFCTEDMIPRSLWEAMNTKQTNLEAVKVAESLPRICFLSGLSGEEMMMFIEAFPETGLEPAVFAALVPNSADKPLQELIEEVMGDHEMLVS